MGAGLHTARRAAASPAAGTPTYAPTSGAVTARNVAYNAAIAPNASVEIGFQATHTGDAGKPTSFALTVPPARSPDFPTHPITPEGVHDEKNEGGRRSRRAALALPARSPLTAVAVATAPAAAGTTLGASAAEKGRYFGAAVAANKLSDARTTTILNREFNPVTPENEMKMGRDRAAAGPVHLRQRPTGSSTTRAARACACAATPWPGTPSSRAGCRACRGSALRTAMLNHVTQVATYYRGKISPGTW